MHAPYRRLALIVLCLFAVTASAQAQRAARLLPVQVIDAATRKPIAKATVRYQYDYVMEVVIADEEGRLNVPVSNPEPAVHITASADNFVGRQTVRKISEEDADLSPLVIELDAGHRLGGLVIDVDGRPVEGVGVGYFLQAPSGDGVSAMGTAITDKAGRWSANVFPPDQHQVQFRVSHHRYGTLTFTRSIDAALRDQTDVITLHFPLTLEFTVTDGATGQVITDRKAFRVTYLSQPALDSDFHPVNIGSGKGDFSVWFPASIDEAALRIDADGFETVTSPRLIRDKDRKPVQWDAVLKRAKAAE